MKLLDSLLHLSAYLLSGIGLLFWAFVIFRIVRYPENHVGWNILLAEVIFIALAVFSAINYFHWRSPLSLGLAIFAVISCIAIFGMYHFNILVPYETWLKRGMPERPF